MKKIFQLLSFVVIVFFSSCFGDEPVDVEFIELNHYNQTISVGDSFNLIAYVLPICAENPLVSWSSSNSDIAIVDNGVVVGVSSGEVNIIVTSDDGGKTAVCIVTVTQ